MWSQNLVKWGILTADDSLLPPGENRDNFMKAGAAMPSPFYPKAPSIFCVWKWRTMNCYCVTRLMSSALYEAGICSNPSVSQPILLGVFYFGCLDCSYGPSTNNSVEQHAWKYVPAYPRSLCQLEKQSIHQLLTRYTALVKKTKLPSRFLFEFTPWPIVALQVNLDWHLLCRALWCSSANDGAFIFIRLGSFIGNPNLLSKWCFSVSYLHTPKLQGKRFNITSLLLSLARNTYKLRVGEKFKCRIANCFPVNTRAERIK